MSKFKSRPFSKKKENMTAQDKAQEAKFFKVTIIVTVILVVIMYLIYRNF